MPPVTIRTPEPAESRRRWQQGWLVAGPGALLAIHLAAGLRVEHVAIIGFAMVLSWAGPRARSFLAVATPLIAVGVGYELLRWVMPMRGSIHVAELHTAELALFGMHTSNGVHALSEIVASTTNPLVDALAGATYLLYLLQVIVVVVILYLKDRGAAAQLAYGFLVINLLGWAIWIAWPSAPPWYVDQYGLGPARMDVPSSAAGALRFDAWLGIPVFQRFYAKSTNVFGAMPSLHMGYAVLSVLAARHAGLALRLGTIVFALSMAFSAVYLRHHYLLDVVAGAALAVVVHFAVRAALGLGSRDPLREASPERVRI